MSTKGDSDTSNRRNDSSSSRRNEINNHDDYGDNGLTYDNVMDDPRDTRRSTQNHRSRRDDNGDYSENTSPRHQYKTGQNVFNFYGPVFIGNSGRAALDHEVFESIPYGVDPTMDYDRNPRQYGASRCGNMRDVPRYNDRRRSYDGGDDPNYRDYYDDRNHNRQNGRYDDRRYDDRYNDDVRHTRYSDDRRESKSDRAFYEFARWSGLGFSLYAGISGIRQNGQYIDYRYNRNGGCYGNGGYDWFPQHCDPYRGYNDGGYNNGASQYGDRNPYRNDDGCFGNIGDNRPIRHHRRFGSFGKLGDIIIRRIPGGISL